MRDRERPQPARAVDRRLDTPAGGRISEASTFTHPWTRLDHHLGAEPPPPIGSQAVDRWTSKSELRTGITHPMTRALECSRAGAKPNLSQGTGPGCQKGRSPTCVIFH